MNKMDYDVLGFLLKHPYETQRELAELLGCSLGSINQTLARLQKEGYLNNEMQPTELAGQKACQTAPKNAIILAAGFGMRMVPINTEIPKGLIEVNGERLIERLIKQLHAVGIEDISIVVGFMKEQFEYLIDKYNVKLTVNPLYAEKNNMHSLALLEDTISDTYIIPSDIWCRENPFHEQEFYSWYMVKERLNSKSPVRVNRRQELVSVEPGKTGNHMVGICYLCQSDAPVFRGKLQELCADSAYDHFFWDDVLYQKGMPPIVANVVPEDAVTEIDTYEQLRSLDPESPQIKSAAIDTAAQALKVSAMEIHNITVLKKGMTNRSFLFSCQGRRYIMRIPGEGTDQLINRKEEAQVYHVIADQHICDEIRYINPDTGYKITEYLEGARNCDPFSWEDVKKCMKRLCAFHELGLKVDHEFDMFGKIEFYESLWEGQPSVYGDYAQTKQHVLELKTYIDQNAGEKVLTHIDAVPDNFLFTKGPNGEEDIRLIDWEYAGMQDPHVDLAMFCIYALYEREDVDRLIDAYFTEGCPEKTRTKIYCYIAVCGLLWSNWCEYKRNLGVEFGEYSLKQYRYAKDYYKIAKKRIAEEQEK